MNALCIKNAVWLCSQLIHLRNSACFPLSGNHHSKDHPFFPILVFFLYFFPLEGKLKKWRRTGTALVLKKNSLIRRSTKAPHPNVRKTSRPGNWEQRGPHLNLIGRLRIACRGANWKATETTTGKAVNRSPSARRQRCHNWASAVQKPCCGDNSLRFIP